MRARWMSTLPLIFLTGLLASACGQSTTTPSTVSSVTVAGTAPAVAGTSQFTATAVLSDGTSQNVTASATWQSADPTMATVSASGLVTGVAAGTVNITATYQNVTGSDQITIATP